VQEAIWAETFKYMADNNVMFEGILLKPAMVTPGADNPNKCPPETVASYTLRMLRRRVPPAVPGIMFLSGGQSELEATLNLNAMNQSPNPWHVSFSYARALQNSVLKTWQVGLGVLLGWQLVCDFNAGGRCIFESMGLMGEFDGAPCSRCLAQHCSSLGEPLKPL